MSSALTRGAVSRVYDTARWKRFRLVQLRREPLCRLCAGQGLSAPALHVDHVRPLADGGAPFDFDNVRSLCAACHGLVTVAWQHGRPLAGCDVDGNPVDASHRWNSTGGRENIPGEQPLPPRSGALCLRAQIEIPDEINGDSGRKT
jgi:5-methylcytosine-specific restriction enzyme A